MGRIEGTQHMPTTTAVGVVFVYLEKDFLILQYLGCAAHHAFKDSCRKVATMGAMGICGNEMPRPWYKRARDACLSPGWRA